MKHICMRDFRDVKHKKTLTAAGVTRIQMCGVRATRG